MGARLLGEDYNYFFTGLPELASMFMAFHGHHSAGHSANGNFSNRASYSFSKDLFRCVSGESS
jgi:hypothetical protein